MAAKPTVRAQPAPIEDPAISKLRHQVEAMDQELARARGKVPTSGVNSGLRMILIAAVIGVMVSWVGAIGIQYVKLMMVQELVKTDQDSLRVMCAVNPPAEREFNRLHLCEVIATGGPTPPQDANAEETAAAE